MIKVDARSHDSRTLSNGQCLALAPWFPSDGGHEPTTNRHGSGTVVIVEPTDFVAFAFRRLSICTSQ